MFPGYMTSKEATFVLVNEDSRSWWFDRDDGFFIIDHLPDNYPEIEFGLCYPDKQRGIERLKEMLEEGWELLKGEIPEEVSCS